MIQRQQLHLEYLFNCTPRLMFPYLSTPDGLQEWLAESVRIENRIYHFRWGAEERTANLSDLKLNALVRFRWLGEHEGEFLEMRISADALTGELSLAITDFSDNDEADQYRMVWDNCIADLRSMIGA